MKIISKKNRGFSLVELLVVIAIIGIIASLGVPQIKSIMDKAKITKDKANAKMIASMFANAMAAGACNTYYESQQMFECFSTFGICHDDGGLEGASEDELKASAGTAIKILRDGFQDRAGNAHTGGCKILEPESGLVGTSYSIGSLSATQLQGALAYLKVDGSTRFLEYDATLQRDMSEDYLSIWGIDPAKDVMQ